MRKCYLKIPIDVREQALGRTTFTKIIELSRKDPEAACRLIDDSLVKILHFAEQHDGLM